MTALGLAVAIPAVLGYNALVRGNKDILTKLNRFAHDLHAYFVTGARVQQRRRGRQGRADEEGSLSMAFGTQDDTDEVMNEINMTPLVDVMLVLLIIFIITVPVMKHAVNIDLPRASSQPQDIKPADRAPVGGRRRQLLLERAPHWRRASCRRCCRPRPPRTRSPTCTSAATRTCATRRVAQAMAAAQQAGLRKIGFITEPRQP